MRVRARSLVVGSVVYHATRGRGVVSAMSAGALVTVTYDSGEVRGLVRA